MAQPQRTDHLTIGELIRRKRQADGFTQKRVGDILGINQSTVTKWEKGERPRVEILPAIAKYLERPFAEVLAFYHDDHSLAGTGQVGLPDATLAAELRALVVALAPLAELPAALHALAEAVAASSTVGLHGLKANGALKKASRPARSAGRAGG